MGDTIRLVKSSVLLIALGVLIGCCLWSVRAQTGAPVAAADQAAPAAADEPADWLALVVEQRRRAPAPSRTQAAAKKVDYSKFTHESHTGEVEIKGTRQKRKLDCANCHQVTKDKPDPQSYPAEDLIKFPKVDAGKNHSACIECHRTEFFTREGGARGPAMCQVCHTAPPPGKIAQAWKELKPFPDPAVAESDFGDLYSHKSHVSYFPRRKFECTSCHEIEKKGVMAGVPRHKECFTCHFNEEQVPKNADTFATKCDGCHTQPVAGKVPHAVNFFVRETVTPQGPDNAPFSHKTHGEEQMAEKGQALCLACHTTGLTAQNRLALELDAKAGQQQPPFSTCFDCHKNKSRKPAETAKLENVNCLYCHSLDQVKAAKTGPKGFPPPSHLSKKPPAQPATKPAEKPAEKPAGEKPGGTAPAGLAKWLGE